MRTYLTWSASSSWAYDSILIEECYVFEKGRFSLPILRHMTETAREKAANGATIYHEFDMRKRAHVFATSESEKTFISSGDLT